MPRYTYINQICVGRWRKQLVCFIVEGHTISVTVCLLQSGALKHLYHVSTLEVFLNKCVFKKTVIRYLDLVLLICLETTLLDSSGSHCYI